MARLVRSPPARGWTDLRPLLPDEDRAFPARAGMDRSRGARRRRSGRVPRPRGDGPFYGHVLEDIFRRSPPARGWTVQTLRDTETGTAFPARAGMDRRLLPDRNRSHRVPRPRGDGPLASGNRPGPIVRSPPARGWTDSIDRRSPHRAAFPARAGMDRWRWSTGRWSPSVPRPRGDGPVMVVSPVWWWRSPPVPGWTGVPVGIVDRVLVFLWSPTLPQSLTRSSRHCAGAGISAPRVSRFPRPKEREERAGPAALACGTIAFPSTVGSAAQRACAASDPESSNPTRSRGNMSA